jgi:hypothetical protein
VWNLYLFHANSERSAEAAVDLYVRDFSLWLNEISKVKRTERLSDR